MIPPTVTLKGIWAAAIALAFATVLALLAVQTVRLEGFKMWPFEIEGCLAKSERLEADLDRVKEAQATALLKAQAAKAEAEENYRNLAEETDEQLEQVRTDAMAAAERYIAANRVRYQAPRSVSERPPSAAEDRDSGLREEVPADTFVAVTDDDVRACTDVTAYALELRGWALKLNEGE